MPLYQYVCETCGRAFDQLIPFNQLDAKPECPHCHSPNTRKQLSMFAQRGETRADAASGSCSSRSRSGHFT